MEGALSDPDAPADTLLVAVAAGSTPSRCCEPVALGTFADKLPKLTVCEFVWRRKPGKSSGWINFLRNAPTCKRAKNIPRLRKIKTAMGNVSMANMVR